MLFHAAPAAQEARMRSSSPGSRAMKTMRDHQEGGQWLPCLGGVYDRPFLEPQAENSWKGPTPYVNPCAGGRRVGSGFSWGLV